MAEISVRLLNGNTLKINDDDILNVDKCRDLHERLLEENSLIHQQLDVTSVESLAGAALRTAEKLCATCSDLRERISATLNEFHADAEEVTAAIQQTTRLRNDLQFLQMARQYLRVLRRCYALDEHLKSEFTSSNCANDELCTTLYANLCEISRHLAGFRGEYLRQYLDSIIVHWHEILCKKLSGDLDGVLEQIKWPFIQMSPASKPPISTILKLQLIFEYLLQIEVPMECGTHDQNFCLPITLLVKPLKKRFLYHFYGVRQTNRLDKPEWYFTRILTWIRDHVSYVVQWLQPVITKMGLHHIDVQLLFINCLVRLAVEKLRIDLGTASEDYIFSHIVDEALGFDRELRDVYEFPRSENGVLAVLTQGLIFTRWLAMERKYATEKMDEMLTDRQCAFATIASDVIVDDVKISVCADAFIALLQIVTERYECLPQPAHRLQFLQLQLDLLDDFRVRLLQLANTSVTAPPSSRQSPPPDSTSSSSSTTPSYNLHSSKHHRSNAHIDLMSATKLPQITNTVHYIESALIDWSTKLHFLNLAYFKRHQSAAAAAAATSLVEVDEENDSVFTEITDLYQRFRTDLLDTLIDYVLYNVKIASKAYIQHVHWSMLKPSTATSGGGGSQLEKQQEIQDVASRNLKYFSLTPEACPFFECLTEHLHRLNTDLCPVLFDTLWRGVASQLDVFLVDSMVLENRFSPYGAMQLKYDISRNLLALFSQYTVGKPELYFKQILSAIALLTVAKGTALLLRDAITALEGATGVENTSYVMLKDVGVSSDECTPAMAVRILNQRCDITVNRHLEFD